MEQLPWSDDMKTIADELMERGEEKGRKEELVDTLKFFLEKKFGELSDELIEKMENSSIADLKKVKRNFFDIESLDEVNDLLD